MTLWILILTAVILGFIYVVGWYLTFWSIYDKSTYWRTELIPDPQPDEDGVYRGSSTKGVPMRQVKVQKHPENLRLFTIYIEATFWPIYLVSLAIWIPVSFVLKAAATVAEIIYEGIFPQKKDNA